MFSRKATLSIDLVRAKQDGAEKLRKCLKTGGEPSASDLERLAGHWEGIIEEAKMNIKQAQEKQKKYIIANMPTHMPSRLALKS